MSNEPKVYRAKISDLKTLGDSNPNKGTERGVYAVEKSLEKFGAMRSIAVAKDGTVLAGNHTLEAYAAAGNDDVLVVETNGKQLVVVKRTDLAGDDAKAKEYAVADNRSSELGLEWNAAQIQALIDQDINLSDWFQQDELAELLAGLDLGGGASDDPGADVDRAGELQVKWNTQRGQVWEIGEHRLACIDSTNRDEVMRFLGDVQPGMVFADPPYGISIVATNGYVGGGEAYDIPFGGVKNKRLGSVGGAKPFGSEKPNRGSDGASNIVEVGKYAPVIGDETTDTAVRAVTLYLGEYPDAVQVWWGGNYYTDALKPSPCWLVWDKENTGNFADCELAWTNQKTAVRKFEHRWNGMLKDSEQGIRRVHPTQKPVALAEWVFEKYAPKDKPIVDPFAGSGITLVAGQNQGRQVMAMELSHEYVAVILERLSGMGLAPRLVGLDT